MKILLATALIAFNVIAEDPAPAEQPVSPLTVPEGVVPTPAQTNNPKLIGVGMIVIGIGMGLVLFARGGKTETVDQKEENS